MVYDLFLVTSFFCTLHGAHDDLEGLFVPSFFLLCFVDSLCGGSMFQQHGQRLDRLRLPGTAPCHHRPLVLGQRATCPRLVQCHGRLKRWWIHFFDNSSYPRNHTKRSKAL